MCNDISEQRRLLTGQKHCFARQDRVEPVRKTFIKYNKLFVDSLQAAIFKRTS
jgi:hypothetical protein